MVASLVMWMAVRLVEVFIPWRIAGPLDVRIYFLCASILIGMSVYFLMSWLLKCPEMVMFVRAVRGRILKKR
jgi:uncharacterized membrane-anchored protein